MGRLIYSTKASIRFAGLPSFFLGLFHAIDPHSLLAQRSGSLCVVHTYPHTSQVH
jgi:hypothetical protein